jgi:hypothetical protein
MIDNNKRKFETVTRWQPPQNWDLGEQIASHQYHIKREVKRVNHTFHYGHHQRMGCTIHS